jgi:NAD(P)-dependent dehydrogenase (short-subunit alcohol dehydrogenase family)
MKAIITGTSRGVGKAVAEALISRSDTPVHLLCISRTESTIDAEMGHPGSTIHYLQADIFKDIENISSYVTQELEWNQINILFHNAGVLKNELFETTGQKEILQMFQTNAIGPYLLTQALLSKLNQATWAHVVCTGSMGGVAGSVKFPGLSAYSMSKSAIHTMVQCLAEEFKESSIRFNAIALGAVQTEMLAHAFPGYEAKITPEKIAQFIVDFLVEGHKYMNGKVLPLSVSTP